MALTDASAKCCGRQDMLLLYIVLQGCEVAGRSCIRSAFGVAVDTICTCGAS